jgi:hypothetical protein
MVYGRVYSIRSHQTPDIYIGSTIQTLSRRMAYHRADYKAYLNEKQHYISSYEILQYNDAYIELLFEGEFESKNALQKKEGEYQREMDCVNKQIAGRTQQEYYEDNKEHIVEYQKQYYEENKPQIEEQHKKYYEEHKPQIAEYHKQYQTENKEHLAEYQKQHYEDNKEQRLKDAKNYRDKHREKYTCECGSILCKLDKSRHERSKKHLEFLNITV